MYLTTFSHPCIPKSRKRSIVWKELVSYPLWRSSLIGAPGWWWSSKWQATLVSAWVYKAARELYPISAAALLSSASKLDTNSGFWQVTLAEESCDLTTFITPFGWHQFNKLPFAPWSIRLISFWRRAYKNSCAWNRKGSSCSYVGMQEVLQLCPGTSLSHWQVPVMPSAYHLQGLTHILASQPTFSWCWH